MNDFMTPIVEGRVRQVSDELRVVLSLDEALGREGVSEHVKEGGKGTDQEGGKEMPEYLAPGSPVPHLVKGQLPTLRTKIVPPVYLVIGNIILLRRHPAYFLTFNFLTSLLLLNLKFIKLY